MVAARSTPPPQARATRSALNSGRAARSQSGSCATWTRAARHGARIGALLLAVAAGGRAQEGAPPATPPPAAPQAAPQPAPREELPASDPQAVALLAKAATVQRGATAAGASEAPLALKVRVQLQYRSPQGDEISVAAERRFAAPDRIWTRAKSSFDGAETWSGFDGKRPWLKSGKQLRWLDEPGAEQDLRQLRQDLELTELLTAAFQLDRLGKRLVSLQMRPDVSANGLTAKVIEGTLVVSREGREKKAVVWLYFEEKEFHLMGARLLLEGEEPLQVCFTKHERSTGLDVPRKIELWADGETKPRQTLQVIELDVAPKLTEADFAPPR